MPSNLLINNIMALYKGYNTIDNKSTKTRLEDFELIKRDLANHFNIRRGEKLMNPDFGTIIWEILFEPLTEEIKDAIIEDVTRVVTYEPRIIVDNILVDEYQSGIIIEIRIRYKNTDQTDTMRFMFDQNSRFAFSS